MTKRVWIYVDLPIGGPTGAAYMAQSWARELAPLGWKARIYAPSHGRRERAETDDLVTFRTLKGVGYKDDHHPRVSILGQLWKYRRRADRPDAMIVTTPMRMGSIGLALATAYRIPLVIAVSTDTTVWAQHHSATRMILVSWPKFALFGLMRPDLAWKWALKPELSWFRRYGSWSAGVAAKYSWVFQERARELILLGERNVADYAHSHPHQRVNVFSAGIDRLPEPTDPPEIPWRPGALRVLFVGRLVKEKAIATLLNAIALCKQRGLDVQMAAVGEGEQAGKLPRMAQLLGIDDLIVAGPFPRDQLRAVYESGDVFGFPSTFETQGFVLNEAAHEGLPLLVADDINRVCVHEESALILDQTPEAFADAIQRLADPAERARLGDGARRLAQQFTEAGQAQQVAAILDRTVATWPYEARLLDTRIADDVPVRPAAAPDQERVIDLRDPVPAER